MKTCIAVCLAICALVVAVYSTECGDAISPDIACNSSTGCGDGLELACEHHQCTCATIPKSCVFVTDCGNITCNHKDNVHCQDNKCICNHDP